MDDSESTTVNRTLRRPSRGGNRSFAVVVVALVVAAGVLVGSISTVVAGPSPHPDRTATGHVAGGPILGLLQATEPNFGAERTAGVQSVTIGVSWSQAEPTGGSFSLSYLASVQSEIGAARATGLGVVLDPGLQYPPAWAFALPGGTQFVDQFGDVFTGTGASGNDVVNAVTDMAVRSAEGSYLSWLGTQFTPGEIIAVREGGGPLGELRYPSGEYDGHADSFWAFDASTQAALPPSVQGWDPGTGTTTQAQTFLTAYNQDLDDYGIWLNGQLQADFATEILVLLPGWGERPGGAATEVAALLDPTPSLDEFNQGLDWADLLSALPDPSDSVAYTTYLDAPTVEPTLQLEDPADYLAWLVTGTPIGLGGENTGNGTVADLTLCMTRAAALGFFIVDWMGESQLDATASGTDPAGPTLAQLGWAFESAMGSPPATLALGATTLPLATVGQPYSATLTASGGEPSYTWSLTAGALPAGLSLDPSTGVVSGTPASAGRADFTVGVTDSIGSTATATLHIVTVATGSQQITAPVVGMASTPDGGGYWLVDSSGDVESFGDASYFGSLAGQPLNAPITHIVATPDGAGYWLVAADGGIFTFGDATFFGSMGGHRLNAPVVDLASTPDGAGYWLVASDGGIFSFGDAAFFGSMGGHRLNAPVVGIAADPDSGGYWLVASDGGIFSFDAPFFGSTGSLRLNRPIIGMAGTADGKGYWFVGSDGGIFSFGGATFQGSTGAIHLNKPIVGMTADPATGGYWLVAADGGVFSFGAPFFGAE